MPWRPDFNALLYVLAGSGTVGAESRPIHEGQLAVMGAGDVLVATADVHQDGRTPVFEALLLGGMPIGEQIAWYGPFVMNTHEEIVQAVEHYQAGRMGRIPARQTAS